MKWAFSPQLQDGVASRQTSGLILLLCNISTQGKWIRSTVKEPGRRIPHPPFSTPLPLCPAGNWWLWSAVISPPRNCWLHSFVTHNPRPCCLWISTGLVFSTDLKHLISKTYALQLLKSEMAPSYPAAQKMLYLHLLRCWTQMAIPGKNMASAVSPARVWVQLHPCQLCDLGQNI